MQRDLDLVRDLLLTLEEQCPNNIFSSKALPEMSEVAPATVLAHFTLLYGAGYIERARGVYLDSPLKDKYSISYQGYDFLDSVRDPALWAKTKEAASSAGGFTLSLIGAIAEGLIKTKLKQHAGIEI
tara:strand:- start:1071 stop:1451 length:381 start_codon:yes stop_codon:yes gene_type:complete